MLQHNKTTGIDGIEHETMLTEMAEEYMKRMFDYVFAVPNIPPTMFELKHRHSVVKDSVLKMYQKMLMDNGLLHSLTSSSNSLLERLEKAFASVAAKNHEEYKLCQTGFIIGWKQSSNNDQYRF